MKKNTITFLSTSMMLVLIAFLPIKLFAQFTMLAEFESGDDYASYFFDEDGEPFYYGTDEDAGTTTIYDFSTQAVQTIEPFPSNNGPVRVSEITPLKRAESAGGGKDFYINYSYNTNRIGSCIFRGNTGVIDRLVGYTVLVRTKVGLRYILKSSSSGGTINSDFLFLSDLTLAGSIPGRVRLVTGAGGRGFFVVDNGLLARYNDDFSLRYSLEYEQEGYLSMKQIPRSTLGDDKERFVVAKRDTIGGEPYTRIQIVDSLYQVLYDTAYQGAFVEIQFDDYPNDDFIAIDILGGNGGLDVVFRVSTLEVVDEPELIGPSVFLPIGRYFTSRDNSLDYVVFNDRTTGDSVWSVPREIDYNGSSYNYSRGLAFSAQESYNGAWFQYYSTNKRLVTDEFGGPLDTVRYESANSQPTFYPIQYDGKYYLFTRSSGDQNGLWDYAFYRYDDRLINTHNPSIFMDVQLAPNPAQTSFRLQSDELSGERITVRLYDPLGRLVQEHVGVTIGESLSLSVIDGLYAVAIFQEGRTLATLPLMVQNR